MKRFVLSLIMRKDSEHRAHSVPTISLHKKRNAIDEVLLTSTKTNNSDG